jgi:hypothetical protein
MRVHFPTCIELSRVVVDGDIVIVVLALQRTHKGPHPMPMGTIPPTGKRINAPCCDVFCLLDGKILFNCYLSGTPILRSSACSRTSRRRSAKTGRPKGIDAREFLRGTGEAVQNQQVPEDDDGR